MITDERINVDDVHNSLKRFGFGDYVVFMFMLLICSVIGLFFAYTDHKKQDQKKNSKVEKRRGSDELEYLVGGRKMQIFPVAMSLVASGLSGIALLGEVSYFLKR